MGKKSLVAGIILILISIFFTGRSIDSYDNVNVQQELYVLLTFSIFALPPLLVGIFLLRKYFRSRKTEKQFIDSQNYQDKPQKYEPKTNDETQFWVCPVCGKDTKELDGKSYCDNCQRYL